MYTALMLWCQPGAQACLGPPRALEIGIVHPEATKRRIIRAGMLNPTAAGAPEPNQHSLSPCYMSRKAPQDVPSLRWERI